MVKNEIQDEEVIDMFMRNNNSQFCVQTNEKLHVFKILDYVKIG